MSKQRNVYCVWACSKTTVHFVHYDSQGSKLLTATCESSSAWKKNFFFVAAVQVERNITVQRGGGNKRTCEQPWWWKHWNSTHSPLLLHFPEFKNLRECSSTTEFTLAKSVQRQVLTHSIGACRKKKNNRLTLLRAVLIHIGVVQKNKAWPCSGSVKPICCASKWEKGCSCF